MWQFVIVDSYITYNAFLSHWILFWSNICCRNFCTEWMTKNFSVNLNHSFYGTCFYEWRCISETKLLHLCGKWSSTRLKTLSSRNFYFSCRGLVVILKFISVGMNWKYSSWTYWTLHSLNELGCCVNTNYNLLLRLFVYSCRLDWV